MTVDTSWHKNLQNALVRESRTLLLFMEDSFPWARSEEQPALSQLQQMLREQREAGVRLSSFMHRQRIALPWLPPYPMHYASLIFVSLDFLLPQLIADQRQGIALLETDVAAVHDRDARTLLESFLSLKRRHLKQLEELATAAAKPAHV